MAPKKRKKNPPKKKKDAPKQDAPQLPIIIPVVVPEASPPILVKPGKACICIENNEGWFCMKRLPNGELKECDGPFDTKEECEDHVCR
jgi:hypothetical protein